MLYIMYRYTAWLLVIVLPDVLPYQPKRSFKA